MQCSGCGSNLRDDARICLSCGEMVRPKVAPSDRLEAVPAGVPAWIAFEARKDETIDYPASRVSRVIAFIIDSLLISFVTTGVYLATAEKDSTFAVSDAGTSFDLGIPIWALVAMFLLQALYYIVPPATAMQATPGKKLLGMRIVNLEGERIGIVQSLVRFVCYSVFWWVAVPLTLFIGVFALAVPVAVLFLMGEGRSPWDVMAGTKVVD